MSAFLMHQDWPTAASDGRFVPDAPFLSYAGTAVLEGEYVIHRVALASQPFFVGQVLRRAVKLDGDLLTLTSDIDRVNRIEIPVQTLVWQCTLADVA